MFHLDIVIYFLLISISFSVVQTLLVDRKFLTFYVDYFEQFYYNNSANLTEECKKSMNGSTFLETKMFDASSKIPVGIFETDIDDLGNFDECYEYTSSSGKMFYGKYCLGQMDINYEELPQNLEIFYSHERTFISSAFCLPSTCKLHDFETLYYQHNFSDDRCSSRADIVEYSVWIKLSISLLTIIITVVSVATVYHWVTDSKKKNWLIQISAISSCKTLFSTQKKEKEFTSLYGMRCITMSWIILDHTNTFQSSAGISNHNAFFEILIKPENMYLTYGGLSVTSYLTIGSVPTSYNFLKDYEEKEFSVTWNCIQRYFGLTPLLAVRILVDASIYELGSGPLWYKIQGYMSKPCQQYWWSTLLYVQNYTNPDSVCVPQAWCLSADMQCYVIFSILFRVLSKRKRWMVPVLLTLLPISAIIVFFVLYNNNLLLEFFSDDFLYKTLYQQPTHTRFGCYVVGSLTGIWLHQISSKNIVIPKKLVVLIILCLVLVMVSIFGVGYFVLEDFLGFALLMAAKEILWTGMIGGLIFMCESGNADFINGFLSLPFFEILAKLTHGMYLVSVSVTWIRIYSSRIVQEISLYNLYQNFFSDFVTSLIVSFLLYIFIEMPSAHIGNFILGKIRGYMK